ncbi:glutamine amidotransferase [Acidovorax sp. LjRoot118]|uniref:glutamine amidotransferase n=1 Tax=Acidovorax sp. LjRoot118 TaxID=3342256 RepID=UPI003ECE680C
MKTSLVLRHVPFEDLGLLAPVLQQRGYSVRTHDAGVGPLEDSLHPEPDLLVVLGGPIGAFDETAYPFLADTLALLRERLARRLPVLGICLGAQLMARALGAGVAPMGHKEIGFAPLALTPGGERSVLAPLAQGTPVLHWHGDQFEIPPGAENLATTPLCPHQAFAVGTHALALQFHLEADLSRIEQWLVGHACELAAAGVDLHALRAGAREHGAALAHAAEAVFGAWLDGIEVGGA